MPRIVMLLLVCLLVAGCTVKPRATGSYHGTSGSADEASGSLMLSHPF